MLCGLYQSINQSVSLWTKCCTMPLSHAWIWHWKSLLHYIYQSDCQIHYVKVSDSLTYFCGLGKNFLANDKKTVENSDRKFSLEILTSQSQEELRRNLRRFQEWIVLWAYIQCNVQHHRTKCWLDNGAQEILGCGLAMEPVHFWPDFWQSVCRPTWWTASVPVATWLQPLTHGTRAKQYAWQSATSLKLSASTTFRILYRFFTVQCIGQGDQPHP